MYAITFNLNANILKASYSKPSRQNASPLSAISLGFPNSA